jgi:hypothetical protein
MAQIAAYLPENKGQTSKVSALTAVPMQDSIITPATHNLM